MNKATFMTYREPQIERFPRLSGFSVDVSVTPEHFSFMKSLHGITPCRYNSNFLRITERDPPGTALQPSPSGI